jgi:hypothetical protein
MHHILVSILIIALSLLISIRRNGVQVGYLALSWTPIVLLLTALLHDKAIGFRRFSEVMYHFAYDTSYILVMAGALLLLNAVIRKKPKRSLIVGS